MNIFRRDASVQSVLLASGQTKTVAIKAMGFTAFAVVLPATFTGVALTCEVSADGSTYQALNNDSGAISKTVAQAKSYALPAELAAWPYFKLVSGSTEGADRTLVVTMKS